MARNAASTASIRYRIRAEDPHAHLFEVALEIEEPDPAGQRLALPAWIPGSYLIRDFARHVVEIEARSGNRRIPLEKVDKHTWQAPRCRGPLALRYRVYAWDLSVRGAHLDASHGFFNGTSVFLRVLGREHEPCHVQIEPPPGDAYADWRVATTLPRAGARPWGFGAYRASNYDELIDHPVEMGRFALVEFEAAGVPHALAITGQHDADRERLAADLAKVCETQVRLFEPRTRKPPFERYLFLATVVGDGYGGLEHRASTALLAARNDLPYRDMQGVPEGYRRFLGLASHEYFHAWHVKRIRPRAFTPYDLERENYTRLLWVFEGFTSYYDDLTLARSRVIRTDDYLKALASAVSHVAKAPGRRRQSVADSSFDAWTKYYRQDENSPNAIVSYYTKGALVALCLDLTIRDRTNGRRSLDDVMRLLWRVYGRPGAKRPEGLAEDAMPALVEEATGVALQEEIGRWAHGTEELPLAELLGRFGVSLDAKAGTARESMLGLRLATRQGETSIATVYTGGPAQHAGLSAGDTLVALDGLRVDEKRLRAMLERRRAGEQGRLHVFRRDELLAFDVELGEPAADEVTLRCDDKPGARAKRMRAGWIG